MSDKPKEIIFSRRGQTARTVYDPETAQTMNKLGEVTTQRASHVEPTQELSQAAKDWIWNNIPDADVASEGLPSGEMQELHDALYPPNKWWADCLPVGGPVLGPFDDRDSALEAEANWLRENNIPVCAPCRDGEVEHRTQIEPITEPILREEDL